MAKQLTVAELIDTINTNRLEIAAAMAAIWWAKKLSAQYADKRLAFAKVLEKCILRELNNEGYYTWEGNFIEADDYIVPCKLETDYWPQYGLMAAIVETFPSLQDFELRNILPIKHSLTVYSTALIYPQEGYSGYKEDIPVPAEADIEQLYLELKQS
jgi:hypothetical protein